MAEPIGALRAELSANTAQFERDMGRAAKTVSNTTRELERTARTFQAIGQRMTAVGQSLTVGLTLPLAALGLAAGRAAISFESAFAGVRKTVDATEPEFAALEAGFRKLATTIPVTANELAKIGEAAGQLGIQKDAILGFTETMAQLGVTTNLTADEAATSLAQFANITKMSQGDFDRLGSTIVALGNAGASTEKDIVAMSLRIAGAGEQVGLTEPQIAGLGAALANVGIEAEAGGTAISRTLKEMSLGVARGGEELEKFARVAGMSSAQFRAAFEKDAAGALVAFIEGLQKTKEEGGNVIAVLDQMGITEIRQSDALLRLAGSGDNLRNSINLASAAWQKNTALTDEARKRFATTESQLKVLGNRLTEVGIQLGSALLPAIQALVKAVEGLIPYLEAMIAKFRELPEWAQVAAGIGLVAAALAGPLLLVLGKVATSVSEIIRLYTLLAKTQIGVSIASWVGSFGSLGGALATAGIAIGSFLIAFAQVAAAFAVGWFIGTMIREIGGLGEALDKLAVKVWEFFNGSNKAAEQGVKWTQTVSAAQLGAYNDFVKQQKEKMRLDELEAKSKAGTGAQVVAALGKVRGAVALTAEQQKKAAEEAKKYSEELAASIAKLSGVSAQKEMNLLAAAFTAVGGAAGLTKTQAAELEEQIRKLVEQGAKIPEAFKEFLQGQLAAAFRQAEADFAKMAAAMEGEALTDLIGKQLTESWERVDAAAELAGKAQVDALTEAIALARQEILDNIERARLHYEVTKALYAEGKASKEALEAAKKAFDEARGAWTGAAAGVEAAKTKTEKFAAVLVLVGRAFEELGISADSALGQIINGLGQGLAAAKAMKDTLKGVSFGDASKMQQAQVGLQGLSVAMAAYRSSALEGAAAGAAFGAQFGPWGAAIGGAIGGLLGFIGSSRRAAEEARRVAFEIGKQRAEFINAAGGIDVLSARAAAAHVSLDALFNARTVQEYEAAVVQVQHQLDLLDRAAALTQEAMDRWGVTVEQMGPAFQAQNLHMAAAEITRDFELLTLQGADAAALLSGPMGDAINGIVQRSIEAGVALPEAMRPMIEKMIELGLLVDANGEKITDVSQLNFTETLEAGVQSLIGEMRELIRLLSGMPPEVETLVKVTYQTNGPPPPGVPAGPPAEEPPGFATGGVGDFGRETIAALHGREMILPADGGGGGGIVGDLAEAIARIVAPAVAGGGGGDITIPVYIGGDKLDTITVRRRRAGFDLVGA